MMFKQAMAASVVRRKMRAQNQISRIYRELPAQMGELQFNIHNKGLTPEAPFPPEPFPDVRQEHDGKQRLQLAKIFLPLFLSEPVFLVGVVSVV